MMNGMNPAEERILVCVDYGHTGRKLIRRGGYLARKLNAELIILVFDSLPDEEYEYHKEVDIPIFKQLAKKYGAKVIIKKAKAIDITNVVIDTARKEEVTQVIIGQAAESVWTHLLGRSIIDLLLKELPDADLHVVPKERSEEEEDWEYAKGRKAYLFKRDDGTYTLKDTDPNERANYEGVFFRHIHTDFDNGIFAFVANEDKTIEVRVKEGIVYSLKDIEEDT
ncbi:adenine nucleotide alpha hydrolase family protein [Alteribacillus iranensis]|uniref:Two-component system, OmpR family, sensor histidine kinase KdpD n=1 Tax=Alteribacillus iranensis TaxID=930128 RepID=A0A1I2B2U5_9BACI|nr:universal stress protein UspA [Alteribacillus iranensis]SFE50359.1 two-component system, OmpR family, sensor histidine kinase KdpD [Alteribacillus iranensis]